jgi:hypothetical protein
MNKAGKVYMTRFLLAMVGAGLLLVVVVVVLNKYPAGCGACHSCCSP